MYKSNLYKIRNEKNQSKQNIANILKIDRTTYSHYETENDIIPIKHLNTICNYYNICIDYIFELTNKKNYFNSKNEIDSKLSGTRLKEFRKNQKLTLTKLADITNYSYGTIAGYESGRYLISTSFLYEICKKYNISADYLLGKTDEPKYLNPTEK